MALNMQAPIDKTKEVVKNAIALSKAYELDMNVAIRAAVSALDDNYSMLTRYIPALRTANSEADKAAIYQRTVADGWTTATEELKTNAGALEDFQNTIGDVKEDLGDFVKAGIVPVIKVLKPLLDGFASLDQGTQQASLSTLTLLAVGSRVPAMLAGIRAGIATLNASLGPAGWLILGVSAVATAWITYSSNADEAAKSNKNLADSNRDLKDSFDSVLDRTRKITEALSLTGLQTRQQATANAITKTIGVIQGLYRDLESAENQVQKTRIENSIKANEELLARQKEEYDAFEKLINERRERLAQAESNLTKEQQEALDKRKAYEFETNRITLAEYVAYLESRKEAVRISLGEETAEYLQFIDKLEGLKLQLKAPQLTGDQTDSVTSSIKRQQQAFIDLGQVSTDYNDMIFEQMQAQYNYRSSIIESGLALAETAHGRESKQYADMLRTREQNDANYQKARENLEKEGARAILSIGARLMNAFQGENQFFFEAGKVSSAGMAAINTYEAATVALKSSPPPYGEIAAAANIVFGLLQVQKILSTKYQPPKKPNVKGLAGGGPVTSAMLFDSIFTPEGEDGIAGLQIGEYVHDRETTRKYFPLLESMRRGTFPVPAYASGGPVTEVATAQAPLFDPAMLGAAVEDAVVEGFRQSRLKIEGEFFAAGKELKASLDKLASLKETV